MSATCPDCPATISRFGYRCRSCAAKKKYSDPAQRKIMSEAKARSLADPVKRARVVAAGAKNLSAWHRGNDRDWSAWHAARVDRLLSWCPAERRAEYTNLRKYHGAVEARRIIEAEVPGTLEHARRTIANNNDIMRIREERRRAQAY